jgi:hypothetical protein
MGPTATRTLRGALAGSVAAGVWAAQQPLDKEFFASGYDDVELLGKLVTRDRSWLPIGAALHLGNGAAFGAAYANVAPLLPIPPALRGPAVTMAEHLGLWPLVRITDRLHPARKQLPKLTGNRPAFWQAAWRHLLFGVVLGELERRLNAAPEDEPADFSAVVSTNGHGSLEDAMLAQP